jgi:hypothetical protein
MHKNQKGVRLMSGPRDEDENDRGGSSPDRSPNDDRSDVMNPNNPAYDADQANRGSQASDDDD